jgi:hypothetical protein
VPGLRLGSAPARTGSLVAIGTAAAAVRVVAGSATSAVLVTIAGLNAAVTTPASRLAVTAARMRIPYRRKI